jgi:lysophospholipase L1-like esterase
LFGGSNARAYSTDAAASLGSRRSAILALGGLVVGLTTLALGEVVSRIVYTATDARVKTGLPTKPMLKPWEMADPAHPGNWILRPDWTMTFADALASERDGGFALGVANLERAAQRHGITASEVAFRINHEGYKGPELDRSRVRPRVVAIGDSCTFGTLVDHYSWPRSLERSLAAGGVDAEVVNAGVAGYYPRNALARADDFAALAPDAAVIYIGWNALFSEQRTLEPPPRIALVRGLRAIFGWLEIRRLGGAQGIALAALQKPKRPDLADPRLAALDDYTPSFLADVDALIARMQTATRHVFVATLPGLYRLDAPPSAAALAIGHLPPYTDNPYVVARVAERYNEALRALAARRGIRVIDLDGWARSTLLPPEDYFTDTVHLTEVGQERIGAEVARQIASPLLGR